jgi:hypothetical protein
MNQPFIAGTAPYTPIMRPVRLNPNAGMDPTGYLRILEEGEVNRFAQEERLHNDRMREIANARRYYNVSFQ